MASASGGSRARTLGRPIQRWLAPGCVHGADKSVATALASVAASVVLVVVGAEVGAVSCGGAAAAAVLPVEVLGGVASRVPPAVGTAEFGAVGVATFSVGVNVRIVRSICSNVRVWVARASKLVVANTIETARCEFIKMACRTKRWPF